MQLPLQIAFRNMESVIGIEDAVRARAEALDRFCEQVTGCRVMVDVPHRHHRSGNQYHVRIELTVPGEEIVVNRDPPERTSARELDVALRDAFDAAARLLEDYVRRHRRDVKRHEPAAHARVRSLAEGQDFGFLETPDGREIYFHKNSVLGGKFEELEPGTEVSFVEEAGEKGPQASTVRVVGRHDSF